MKKFKPHEVLALHFDIMKLICIYAKEHDYDAYEIYKDIVDTGHDCPEESSITTMQAFADLGCARLSGRIHDLRQMGYPIESEFVTGKNRYGEPVSFKKYFIRKGTKEDGKTA